MLRSRLLALAKRLLRWGMARPFGDRLTRLIAEERQVFHHDRRLVAIGPELAHRLGRDVLAGPFAGLRYPALAAAGSSLFPKLLGSYEAELHPVLEACIAHRYRTVVNIGAAEGYYAVGLARRMPNATVHAFELDQRAHPLLAAMAAANGVTVHQHGTAEAGALQLLLQDASRPTLVLVDCEGYELHLLDPARVPALATVDVLVELHTVRGRNTGDVLRPRLSATHQVEAIGPAIRDPAHYPALAGLELPDQLAALAERTTDFGWLWMHHESTPLVWALSRVQSDPRSLSSVASRAFPS